jgi:bifunctional non-homologous end joining protein LigD
VCDDAIVHSEYAPQLATLATMPPEGDRWLHEIKFDGYRIGCVIADDGVRLITRKGNDWTDTFPEVAAAARTLKVRDALIDGEIAMLMPDGRSSFEALQQAISGAISRAPLVYLVFDLLRVDGTSTTRLPLAERKALLKKIVGTRKTSRIRYVDHVDGQGDVLLDHAAQLGLEGIVSKRRDLPYYAGRHDSWRKIKCLRTETFVIGGFHDIKSRSQEGIGALVVGQYDGTRLVFSGRVGTGFSHALAIDLRRRLEALQQRECPFDPHPGKAERHAHWVQPMLRCRAAYAEKTREGRLRHPKFIDLTAT